MIARDVFFFAGVGAAAAVGILGAWFARLIFAKVGMVLAAAVICVGLTYSGWKPLFGGSYSERVYFGSAMLALGLLGLAIIGAIEESYRRLRTGADPGRGFPVVPSIPRRLAPPAGGVDGGG